MKKKVTSIMVIVLLVTMTSFNIAFAKAYPTIRYGNKGNQVKVLQNKLIGIGYLKEKATGYFGKSTRAAVIKFQKDNHIYANGLVGTATWNALNKRTSPSTPSRGQRENGSSTSNIKMSALKYGDKGNDVKLLQTKLISMGYLKDKATGYFGKNTRTAVIEFQKKMGLPVSGVAYSETVNSLITAVNEINKPEEKPTENEQQNGEKEDLLKPENGEKEDLPKPDSSLVEKKAETNRLNGKTIIIDPGHGFRQPGVVRGNVYEKNLTLDMGLRLRRILEEAGAKVVMTRDTDGDSGEHYLFYRSAVANKYVLDSEIDKLSKEMEGNKNQLSILSNSISTKGSELEVLKASKGTQSEINNIEDEIAKLIQQEQELKIKIDEQNNNINDLKQKLDSLDEYIKNPSLQNRVGIYSAVISGGYSIASKEITEVFDLTNDKYQKDIVFISIHCNSTNSNEGSSSGIQVYVSDNNSSYYSQYYSNYNQAERERFGRFLMEGMNSNTPFSNKYDKLFKSSLSVLREHNLISALVEVGFVNNSADRTLLIKEQTREDVAFGMYKGIEKYFNETR